ncbi:hypothetical protein L6452_29807 [Arctium lappa]|uniref:Uncharacterized protein n=1 Tax=Arctium lappa TaxID=4217 RepID=A0ACB8ZGE0_ARCLA|nr:hypothetical protein L6452_29807 [Arctium lappa]
MAFPPDTTKTTKLERYNTYIRKVNTTKILAASLKLLFRLTLLPSTAAVRRGRRKYTGRQLLVMLMDSPCLLPAPEDSSELTVRLR